MNDFIVFYSDLKFLIPILAIFIILFGIIFSTLGETGMFFDKRPRAVMSFCASALAMYGLDQTLIQFIVKKYTFMGLTMLISLASLLLITWFKIIKK